MRSQTLATHLAAFGKQRAARSTVKMGAGMMVALFVGAILLGAGAFYVINGNKFSTSGASGPLTPGNNAIYGQVTDAVTSSALGATTKVDIIVPAVSGWSAPYETVTQSSSSFTTLKNYPSGTVFFIHAYSTAGNKYYDGLFGPFTAGAAPFNVGSTTSCVNCVWSQATSIGLYQQSTGANEKFLFTDSLGASCGTATGAVGQTFSTHQGGNTGAVTQLLTESLTLAGSTSTSVTNYGVPMPIITSSISPPGSPGPGSSTLQLVAWLGINMTSGAAWVQQNGWTKAAVQPSTSGQLFYKVLPGVYSSRTGGGVMTFTVPLDLTNGPGTGKHVGVHLWISDMQLPSDANQASPDAAPTAFGAYSGVGPTAVTFSFSSFSFTSGDWASSTSACSVTQ